MKIKNKILYISILPAIFFVLVFYFWTIYRQENFYSQEISRTVKDANHEFQVLLEKDSEIILSSLDVFLENEEYKRVFSNQEKDILFQKSLPLFEKLKNDYSITHFYYHLPEGVNFLRVHNKDISGDNINRHTFIEAQKSQISGVGIELGKTAFALRAVKPYYYQNNLLGYVEFGKEIDNILNNLQEEYDNNFAIIVEKKYINYEDWASIRNVKGLNNNWDDLDDYLLIDSTSSREGYSESTLLKCHNILIEKNNKEEVFSTKLLDRKYLCGSFPLYDAGDNLVGSIVVLEDISNFKKILASSSFSSIVFIIILIVLFVVFFQFFIKKYVIKPIVKLKKGTDIIKLGNLNYKINIKSKDEIGDLANNFNDMTRAIKKSQAEVNKKVKEQTEEIKKRSQDMRYQQKAVLNILEDVQEEKDNVTQERNKIDRILHSIGDGVFVVDENLNVAIFNQVAADISGFSIREALGKRYDEVLKFIYEDTGKVNSDFIDNAFETGEVQEMTNHTVLIKKDGTKVAVADSAAPLKNKDGEIIGCVVVFRDVHKEREVDRAKTEFVSLASHQLRTPLSAINWYAEMLLAGDAGKINEKQKEFIDEIYAGNQRMVLLVNALLNVSRIELGTLSVDPRPTDFSEVAKSLLVELKPSIIEKKIKVEENYDKNLPKINADPNIIRIIFQNLLSNAVKYTPEKGIITISLEKKKEDVLIKIADTGYGIPENQKSRIFEKMFRADNIKEKDASGTGLGLYLVKAIIEDAEGKIWFESKENKGTTFYITIPLSGMKKKEGSKTLNEEKI